MLAAGKNHGETTAALRAVPACAGAGLRLRLIPVHRFIHGGAGMEGLGGDDRDASSAETSPLTESDIAPHLKGVTAMVARRTGDIHLAWDITQEVAMAVLLAVREGRIRQRGALYAYMLQAARNMLMANQRKKAPETMETLPEDSALWQEQTRLPEQVVERGQLHELIVDVLGDLSVERDRQLLRGYYVDGLEKPELMQILQMDAHLFDKTLFRARERMSDAVRKKMQRSPANVEESAPSTVPVVGKSRSS